MDSSQRQPWLSRTYKNIRSELNFYRLHLIYFTITPLIFSGIFYASNGRHHISYIDSLFNCLSAMCVCGLATVNLSSLTGWQQTILFIQMHMGNPIVISWFVVLIRRHYFAREFEHMLAAQVARKAEGVVEEVGERRKPWPRRLIAFLRPGKGISVVAEEDEGYERPVKRRQSIIRKLRPEMIRRMDEAPKPVNPSGWVTDDGKAPSLRKMPSIRLDRSQQNGQQQPQQPPPSSSSSDESEQFNQQTSSPSPLNGDYFDLNSGIRTNGRKRRLSDPGMPSRPVTPTQTPMQRFGTMEDGIRHDKHLPRHQTIEFAPIAPPSRARPEQPRISESNSDLQDVDVENSPDIRSLRRTSLSQHYTRATTNTVQTYRTSRSAKDRDFGGFPMPATIIGNLVNRFFPRFKRTLSRTVTIPMTTSLVSTRTGQKPPPHAKAVPYISFNAIVGRNSAFKMLTNEQLEELGGVEYRALNALLWLVAAYYFGILLLTYTVIAPYMSMQRFESTLSVPQQFRNLPPPWFAAFQVVSAFTNTGMSLVDQSMVPFQSAYTLLVFMIFLILAGNTSYPIFLRLLIWIITKLIPRNSRLNETLHFLLDHPRRCFTHLFPSHQTWFLLTVVLLLTFTDWFFFLVLDIGNAVIEEIPLHTRVIDGLFQAIAVRNAGFSVVSMLTVAPAVKVLYMVMMYISIYPVALSVRSTNVYEEQSLGIFETQKEESEEEKFEKTGPRMSVWSRYLAMHARKQLAFDMWWLCVAIFLLCILERHHINDDVTMPWLNVFSMMFEAVSAYGTVGLSLGIPDQNYSLSGAFRPLSKLIICGVILRGRHRGLPVAIDRAILLPSEFRMPTDDQRTGDDERGETHSTHARHSRRATMHSDVGPGLYRRTTKGPRPDSNLHTNSILRPNSVEMSPLEKQKSILSHKDGRQMPAMGSP